MREILPGMVNISDVGVDLKEAREKAGLTKDRMAILCGVSCLTYNRWETGGTKTAKKENFDQLCRVLKEHCGM